MVSCISQRISVLRNAGENEQSSPELAGLMQQMAAFQRHIMQLKQQYALMQQQQPQNAQPQSNTTDSPSQPSTANMQMQNGNDSVAANDAFQWLMLYAFLLILWNRHVKWEPRGFCWRSAKRYGD